MGTLLSPSLKPAGQKHGWPGDPTCSWGSEVTASLVRRTAYLVGMVHEHDGNEVVCGIFSCESAAIP